MMTVVVATEEGEPLDDLPRVGGGDLVLTKGIELRANAVENIIFLEENEVIRAVGKHTFRTPKNTQKTKFSTNTFWTRGP